MQMIYAIWVIFFVSLFVILWSYAGYPFFLLVFSKVFRKEHRFDDHYTPPVTFLITAHDEEETIEAKIENTLDIDYPKDRLEIIVVDDCSSDSTQNIVKKCGSSGIHLIAQEVHKGKASAINRGIEHASNEIIVITDANAMLKRDALKKIVRHFIDAAVGGVCGRFVPRSIKGNDIEKGESLFWRIQKTIRTMETDLDSVVVLSGSLSAVRRRLLTCVFEDSLAEDFDYTLQIRRKGYRLVYESKAVMWKTSPSNVEDLVIQKKRQTIGTLQSLFKHRNMLFNPKYGWYGAFVLPFHKLFQVLSPIFLVLLFASSSILFLLTQSFPLLCLLYVEFLVLIFMFSSTIFLSVKPHDEIRPVILSKYFLILCAIVLLSWVDYLRGDYQVTWKKIESSRRLKTRNVPPLR